MTGLGFSKSTAFVRLACGRLLVVLVMMGLISATSANGAMRGLELLPLEISPQGVKSLKHAGIPFMPIDAEKHPDGIVKRQQLSSIQHAYYATTGPGFRVAREKVDIVDLRSPHMPNTSPAIPGSRRLLPHQIESDKAGLLKQKWLILVDSGDRVASPIAERLYSRGYVLIALLEGGHPAWLGTTQR